MVAINKVEINYIGESPTESVKSVGGHEGGVVVIKPLTNIELAEPVKEDIDKGIAEDPGATSYEALVKWAEEDNNSYDFQEDYINGKNSVTAKGNNGEEYNVNDITDKNGDVAPAGGFGAGSLETVAKSTLGFMISTLPYSAAPFGEIVTGSLVLAAATVCLAAAIAFDKDLNARKAFAKKVSEYIAETDAKCTEIENTYNATTEDRQNRLEIASANTNETSEALRAQLKEMQEELLKLENEDASEDEIRACQTKILDFIDANPILEQETIDDIKNEGIDDFYSLLAEADGINDGYKLVSQFLIQGKELGDIAKKSAKLIQACLPVGAAMIAHYSTNFVKVPFFMMPAEAANAVIGTILVGSAMLLETSAMVTSLVRMDQEYNCNEKGMQLEEVAITKLTKTINSHLDLDDQLDNIFAKYPNKTDSTDNTTPPDEPKSPPTTDTGTDNDLDTSGDAV